MNERWLVMKESEFDAILTAAIGADINCPYDVAKIKEAEAACRARPVKQVELGWGGGTVYKPVEEENT